MEVEERVGQTGGERRMRFIGNSFMRTLGPSSLPGPSAAAAAAAGVSHKKWLPSIAARRITRNLYFLAGTLTPPHLGYSRAVTTHDLTP